MGGRGVGTAQECGNRAGRGQANSGRFSQAVNQPVGTPVNGGEEKAVALGGNADRKVRFVRGIQTTLPKLTMEARSSPTMCAIIDQTLARGL